ncbi:MAG TPA: uracil-DNA glycosylase [Longimicrobiales bacterium]|nr:uracil-DNA glycosylase [Longimicrobiales bacterium]
MTRSPLPSLPRGWPRLEGERSKAYFRDLEAFLATEYDEAVVYPPAPQVFEALALTPFRNVKVVLLGQDPYHGPGQAHGLAFSVLPGVTPPPSLRNLFRELNADVGVPIPGDGYLAAWARRGVLLLNAALTVRAGEPASHAGAGWEAFTDAVIDRVNAKRRRVVFLLLGSHAQKKGQAVDRVRHAVLEAPHPSPLSARRGFFGSRIFSRANDALAAAGRAPVDWSV